jgi:hypothetical protein
MEDDCSLCHRRRMEGSEYCPLHQRAFKNLEEKYVSWEKALGIDWIEFLGRVSVMKETGGWAREVAASQLKKSREQGRPAHPS